MVKGLFAIGVLLAMMAAVIWALTHWIGLQASMIWAAIVGGGAWLVRYSLDQQKERRRLLAEQKREQYLQFMDFMNKNFGIHGEEAEPDPLSPERLRELRRWSLRLTLIGSDEVVQAWNGVRLTGDTAPSDPFSMLRTWGKLWLEMRKDCGHHDTKLQVSDVLASIVNDIDLHRAAIDSGVSSRDDDARDSAHTTLG